MEGDHVADGFSEFDFLFGGSAEAGAAREGRFDGGEDFGVAMAEEERSPEPM